MAESDGDSEAGRDYSNLPDFESAMTQVRAGTLPAASIDDGKGSLILGATSLNDLESVKYLHQEGVDINAGNHHGTTALLAAAEDGNIAILKWLLEQGADVTVRDGDGDDALLCAAAGGSVEAVSMLIDHGLDLSVVNKEKWTVLHKAVSGAHLPLVTWLLEKGAPHDALDDNGETPLLHALAEQLNDIAAMLLDKGADTTVVDKDGDDAMLCAALGGCSVEIMQRLLDAGRTIHARNKEGETALYRAADGGHQHLVKWFVEQGAEVNVEANDGMTPIMAAANSGSLEAVKCLVDSAAKLRHADETGFTAFLLAVNGGHDEIATYLLQKDAKLLEARAVHTPAIAIAAQSGSLPTVKALIKAGAKVNAADSFHICSCAAMSRKPEMLTWLLSKYKVLNIDATDDDQRTALMECAGESDLPAVEILVDAGAKVKAADCDGKTTLMYAAEAGNAEMVEYLCDHGAAVKGRDKTGTSAVGYALQSDKAEEGAACAMILIKRGASAVEATSELPPLAMGALLGIPELVQAAMQQGAHQNEEIREKAIIAAIEKDQQQILKTLLDAGPVPSVKCFLQTIATRNFTCAQMLVAAGFKIQDPDTSRRLLRAVIGTDYCSAGVIRLLIQQGAVVKYDGREQTPLHMCGHVDTEALAVEVATILLDAGADVDAKDSEGVTPLQVAAHTKGHVALASLLLKRGANINANEGIPAPLLVALSKQRKDLAFMLLEAGADVTITVGNRVTALHVACDRNLTVCVKALLEKGGKPTAVDMDGDTPLHLACSIKQDSVDIIKAILDSGCPVTIAGLGGAHPIHAAAASGKTAAIPLLAAAGADLNAKVASGISAFTLAVVKDHEATAFALIEAGFDVNLADTEGTPLMVSARSQSSDLVVQLIAKGANVNAVRGDGATALMLAVGNGLENRLMLTALINAGCDLNARCGDTNALTVAVKRNATINVSQLLKAGASVEYADGDGDTLLHLVGFAGACEDIACMLIRSGADINALNKAGRAPLYVYITKAMVELVLRFWRMGAKADAHGSSPLHVAATIGFTQMAQLLIQAGADQTEKDALGRTPYQLACENNHTVIAAMLSPSNNVVDSNTAFKGALLKMGEGASASYKRRWVVIENGSMTYSKTEEERERGGNPPADKVIPLAEHALHVVPDLEAGSCLMYLSPLALLVNEPSTSGNELLTDALKAQYLNAPITRRRIWHFKTPLMEASVWFDAFVAHGATALNSLPEIRSELSLDIQARARDDTKIGDMSEVAVIPFSAERRDIPRILPAGATRFAIVLPSEMPQDPDFRARNRELLNKLGFRISPILPVRQPHQRVVRPRSEIVCRLAALNTLCKYVCVGVLARDKEEVRREYKQLPKRKESDAGDGEESDEDSDEDGDDQEENADDGSASEDGESESDESADTKSSKDTTSEENPKLVSRVKQIREVIARPDVAAVIEPKEAAIFALSPGAAHKQYGGSIGWYMENIVGLAWALGHNLEPGLDGDQISGEPLHVLLEEFSPFTVEGLDKMLADSAMRSVEEIVEMEDRLYCAHNAVVTARLRDATAVPVGFGPDAAGGVVWERRWALTWMCSPGVSWTKTDLSTDNTYVRWPAAGHI